MFTMKICVHLNAQFNAFLSKNLLDAKYKSASGTIFFE